MKIGEEIMIDILKNHLDDFEKFIGHMRYIMLIGTYVKCDAIFI
jgi:hypothetical protein